MAGDAAGWWDRFQPFSAVHFVVVLVFIAGTTVLCGLGARWRSTSRESRLRHGLAWANIAVQSYSVLWYLRPAAFKIDESLPLHVCDVCGWLACFALLREARWVRTLTFMWGLGLCTQAFVTPIVTAGPGYTRFWLFWLTHGLIVGTSVYLFVVLRYRPRLRDLGVALAWLWAYGFSAIAINLWLDTNYVFVGRTTPEAPTIVDQLGPWPRRLIWMGALTIGILSAVYGVSRGIGRLVDGRGAARDGMAA